MLTQPTLKSVGGAVVQHIDRPAVPKLAGQPGLGRMCGDAGHGLGDAHAGDLHGGGGEVRHILWLCWNFRMDERYLFVDSVVAGEEPFAA